MKSKAVFFIGVVSVGQSEGISMKLCQLPTWTRMQAHLGPHFLVFRQTSCEGEVQKTGAWEQKGFRLYFFFGPEKWQHVAI